MYLLGIEIETINVNRVYCAIFAGQRRVNDDRRRLVQFNEICSHMHFWRLPWNNGQIANRGHIYCVAVDILIGCNCNTK